MSSPPASPGPVPAPSSGPGITITVSAGNAPPIPPRRPESVIASSLNQLSIALPKALRNQQQGLNGLHTRLVYLEGKATTNVSQHEEFKTAIDAINCRLNVLWNFKHQVTNEFRLIAAQEAGQPTNVVKLLPLKHPYGNGEFIEYCPETIQQIEALSEEEAVRLLVLLLVDPLPETLEMKRRMVKAQFTMQLVL